MAFWTVAVATDLYHLNYYHLNLSDLRTNNFSPTASSPSHPPKSFHKSKMVNFKFNLRFLLLLAVVCLSLVVVAEAISSSASEKTETKLICSPVNETDCYPQVFVPTKDFQVIREGQDIPPGLHVRMDVYKGIKEARLNIPMEEGEDTALEALKDLPIEYGVAVVEQPETVQEPSAMRDQVPIKAPVYEMAGKIQPPRPESNDDFSVFGRGLIAIQEESEAFDSALEALADLSHDIYYGVEIAKNEVVLEKLACLTLGLGNDKLSATENGRDYKAASILGSALQNNPTALKEASKHLQKIIYPTCPNMPNTKASNFVSILHERLVHEKEAHVLKAKLGAISGLIKEPLIRDTFIETGGMELLHDIFLKNGYEFDITRKRVAQLVSDIFLDENMGAELGVWPKMPVSEVKVCESKERMLEDGCWEHNIGKFLAQNKDAPWAKEFLDMLIEQRTLYAASVKDREL